MTEKHSKTYQQFIKNPGISKPNWKMPRTRNHLHSKPNIIDIYGQTEENNRDIRCNISMNILQAINYSLEKTK